ncbi:hypothetical protein HII17_07040 [Thalassotalea sp. M1531]|uniref:DUF7793 domain-containing protein n=1 Tax=Thalassotalea algicola TaxID=2716224 RepID=A0A7Y0LBL5_9GAMM|nr:hypothetical protein [Thalassotalea algicola]NMP31312.1 hypothetical protein [Thalassotalea algicola]
MIQNQHGCVHIECQGNIIIATLTGAFNDLGANTYAQGVEKVVESFHENKYAILVDNTKLEGGTPEAYQIVEQHNQWLNSTSLVAKAFVVRSEVTTNLIKSLSPSVNQQTTKSFNEKSEAMKWLQTLLK